MLPIDMYETENEVVVKAAVPGIEPEDIEVTVTGDLLTIKGEFKTESEKRTRSATITARNGASAASPAR
jgi:HSP20 family protein